MDGRHSSLTADGCGDYLQSSVVSCKPRQAPGLTYLQRLFINILIYCLDELAHFIAFAVQCEVCTLKHINELTLSLSIQLCSFHRPGIGT